MKDPDRRRCIIESSGKPTKVVAPVVSSIFHTSLNGVGVGFQLHLTIALTASLVT